MLRFLVGTALVLMVSVPASADNYRDYDEPERARHLLRIGSGGDYDRFDDNDMAMLRRLLAHLVSKYDDRDSRDDRSAFQRSEGSNVGHYTEIGWRYSDDVDKPHTRVFEPATFLMVGAGLAGLVYARRFFRR